MRGNKVKVQEKRRILITGGLVLTGVLLMAYPFASNYLYERQQEEVIYGYQDTVEKLEEAEADETIRKAAAYNDWLREREVVLTDPFDPEAIKAADGPEYSQLLNLYGDGIMGYVEIPEISVFLPIYHGTSEEVLDRGVGHLENTSLPVGGEGTHCVLSAHTGLSDKKLFTDLVLLGEGDSFFIQVLGETLAYQVDNIQVVTPEDTSGLRIVPHKDYVTLVTCTPYGVNSHRLLVRGHRVPYVEEEKEKIEPIEQTSPWMHQYLLAISCGVLFLLLLLLVPWIYRRAANAKK